MKDREAQIVTTPSEHAALKFRVVVAAAVLAVVCVAMATRSSRAAHVHGYGQAAAELPENHVVQALVRWDAGWYVRISREGYGFTDNRQSPTAFFPGYPLTIAAVTAVTGINSYTAAVFISLLSGLLALFVFSRWASALAGEEVALRAGVLLATYPFAIYLYGVAYSDALLLLFSVLAFWMLERDRLFAAALFGALATATRPLAVALVVGLVVRYVERTRAIGQRPTFRGAVLPFAALGAVGYMAYLSSTFGNPFAFVDAQSAPGWDNAPGWHTWLKLEWFRLLSETERPLIVARLGGHALCAVVALVLCIPTRRLLGWGYASYCALAVGLAVVSSHDFHGVGRYALAAFPLFLTGAILLQRREGPLYLWVVVSAALLFFAAAAFGYGGYVA